MVPHDRFSWTVTPPCRSRVKKLAGFQAEEPLLAVWNRVSSSRSHSYIWGWIASWNLVLLLYGNLDSDICTTGPNPYAWPSPWNRGRATSCFHTRLRGPFRDIRIVFCFVYQPRPRRYHSLPKTAAATLPPQNRPAAFNRQDNRFSPVASFCDSKQRTCCIVPRYNLAFRNYVQTVTSVQSVKGKRVTWPASQPCR